MYFLKDGRSVIGDHDLLALDLSDLVEDLIHSLGPERTLDHIRHCDGSE